MTTTTTTNNTHTITWTSADGQSSIDMSGEYLDGDGAPASTVSAGHSAMAELLSHAASMAEYAAIESGSVDVEHLCEDLTLHDYDSAEVIRRATPDELRRSVAAAVDDGGRGVITVDIDGSPRRCYVMD